jgi:hypothetical protein
MRSLLISVLCIILIAGCGSEENHWVKGRPLSYWVKVLGHQKIQGPKRKKAESAILELGTNAIPYLLKQVRLGEEIDGFTQQGTRIAFWLLGPVASNAVGSLSQIALSSNGIVARDALYILSGLGDFGVKELTNLLWKVDGRKRDRVLDFLDSASFSHSTNGNAKAMISEACLRFLSLVDDDFSQAFFAGSAAARSCIDASGMVETLRMVLKTGAPAGRYGAAIALESLGRDGLRAVPELEMLLNEEDWRLRNAASNALKKIMH